MRKLIIAVSAVMLGVVANAASTNWGVNWAYSLNDGSDDTYNNGLNGTFWVVALGDSATSAISVSEAGEITVGAGATVQSTGSVADGAAAGDLNFAANGDKFALVIYNATYQMFGVSDAATIANYSADPPNPADEVLFSNIYDTTYASSYMVANTAATPVPEPTSGLLMLLGVAGLALRRRRA